MENAAEMMAAMGQAIHNLQGQVAALNAAPPHAPDAAAPQDMGVEDAAPVPQAPVPAPAPADNLPKPGKPPEFSQPTRTLPVELWLWTLFVFFKACNVMDPERKLSYAVSRLRGPAANWWRHVTSNVDEPELLTYDYFCDELTRRFKSDNADRVARERLRSLKQTTSVSAYLEAFLTSLYDIINFTDDDKCDAFLRGLKPILCKDVMMRRPSSFEEAVQFALAVDDAFMATRTYMRPNTNGVRSSYTGSRPFNDSRYYGPMPMDTSAAASSSRLSTPIRPSYGEVVAGVPTTASRHIPSFTGNRLPRSKLTDTEREECISKGICFKFRKPGHLAKECPESRPNFRRP